MKLDKFYVKQSGGKYGIFVCPCCANLANYKFTSNSGWCARCETQFVGVDSSCLGDSEFDDYIVTMDIDIDFDNQYFNEKSNLDLEWSLSNGSGVNDDWDDVIDDDGKVIGKTYFNKKGV